MRAQRWRGNFLVTTSPDSAVIEVHHTGDGIDAGDSVAFGVMPVTVRALLGVLALLVLGVAGVANAAAAPADPLSAGLAKGRWAGTPTVDWIGCRI